MYIYLVYSRHPSDDNSWKLRGVFLSQHGYEACIKNLEKSGHECKFKYVVEGNWYNNVELSRHSVPFSFDENLEDFVDRTQKNTNNQ